MIELNNVSLPRGSFYLKNISMKIDQGGLHLLTGETGAGKTSIIEALCGLQSVESGKIILRGVDVTDATPAARSIGYLPQDVALFDHLTVRENLRFSCQARKWKPKIIRDRVEALAQSLGLANLLDRYPSSLSGGQKHSVAFGRALAFEPDVVCLDEPFVTLDAQTRETMIDWFNAYVQENEVTVLAVTHQPQWLRAVATTSWSIDSRGILAAGASMSLKVTE